MEAEDIGDAIAGIREEVIGGVIDEHLPPETQVSSWDVPGLTQVLELEFGDAIDVQGLINADAATTRDALAQQVIDLVQAAADAKAEQVGTAVMRQIEKEIMLRQLD